MGRKIYLIGSLRNPQIPTIAQQLREDGHDVFDDWYAAGPEADDKWKLYERGRGRSYMEALRGLAAKHVYSFDREHLSAANTVVLILPAGRSGHLELGWALGQGKEGYVVVDDPERWDVMYQFATGVFDKLEDLRERLKPRQPYIWFDTSIFDYDPAERILRRKPGTEKTPLTQAFGFIKQDGGAQ